MQKQARYLALDGLRGVGAVVVLLYHMPVPTVPPWPVPVCFIAVDVFFVLSGIVLGQTYWHRLRDRGYALRFAVHRAIRFLPLHVAGLALPGLYLFQRWLRGGQTVEDPGHALAATTINLAFLPAPEFLSEAGHLFPMNPPAWSLMFELVSNLAFAAIAAQLTMGRLRWLVGLSAGAFAFAVQHYGTLDMGTEHLNLAGGLPRVMFGFFAGVWLSTVIPKVRLPSVPAPVLMLGLLSIIYAPVPEALVVPVGIVGVLVVVPAFLLLASASQPTGWAAAFCNWSGRLSFGIYMLHIGVRDWMGRVVSAVSGLELYQAGLWGNLSVLVATIAVAYMLDRYYDARLRNWLMAHLPERLRARPRPRPTAAEVLVDSPAQAVDVGGQPAE